MATPFDQLKAAMADRYTLERELGAGRIGPERFLKEIQTTANLQHPHILPLFDSGRVAEL